MSVIIGKNVWTHSNRETLCNAYQSNLSIVRIKKKKIGRLNSVF